MCKLVISDVLGGELEGKFGQGPDGPTAPLRTLILLSGSGSGEEVSKVSAWFIRKEQELLSLMAGHLRSLVIDNLCDKSY